MKGLLPAEERQQRFHRRYRVDQKSGCWVWLGFKADRRGYGGMRIDYRTVRAHRYSWEIHNGLIPNGLHVLHRCDNPPCVNPKHLFLGTNSDNVADMTAKGRGRGECKARGGRASRKLSFSQAQDIRREYRKGVVGYSTTALGRKYGVTHGTIGKIVRGLTYLEPSERDKREATL